MGEIYLSSIEKILSATRSGGYMTVVFVCKMDLFSLVRLKDEPKLVWNSFKHFVLDNFFQRKL